MKKNSKNMRTEKAKTVQSRIAAPFVTKAFIIVFFLTFIIIAALTWHTWNSYKQFKTAETSHNEILELSGEIMLYDEFLTSSALTAAASGD